MLLFHYVKRYCDLFSVTFINADAATDQLKTFMSLLLQAYFYTLNPDTNQRQAHQEHNAKYFILRFHCEKETELKQMDPFHRLW